MEQTSAVNILSPVSLRVGAFWYLGKPYFHFWIIIVYYAVPKKVKTQCKKVNWNNEHILREVSAEIYETIFYLDHSGPWPLGYGMVQIMGTNYWQKFSLSEYYLHNCLNFWFASWSLLCLKRAIIL